MLSSLTVAFLFIKGGKAYRSEPSAQTLVSLDFDSDH